MKRALIAALAATLSTGALAVSGDAWYGTNRADPTFRAEPDAPMQHENRVIYEERIATAPTYLVPGEYIIAQPREVIVYSTPAPTTYWYTYSTTPAFDPLHPQQGQVVGRGLFNRNGPNDFGE